jgi:DNA-binding transcriptional LysR family regulator
MFSDSDISTAMAVNRSGSIRAAAKIMHKSQPAVSQAIMRLESKLGFKLFDRSQYRIALTKQGYDFLQRSEAIVSIDAQLQDYAEVIRKGQESALQLAVWPMVSQDLLMRVLHTLNSNYPQTSIHINYIESLGSFNQLLDNRAAIAICPRHPLVNSVQIESQSVGQISLINVIASKLLQQKPKNRSLREQLLYWNRAVVQDSVSGKSYGIGVHEGGKHWLVNDQRILSSLIFEGLAWGMLPEPLVNDALTSGELIKLDYPEFGGDLDIDIAVSRLKTNTHGPVANACWQAFLGDGS